jgi:predicted PurR-regulated permease PerM
MVLGITLGVLLVLSLGFLAWKAITWVLVAVFLAMALNPAVELFERRGMRRSLAATTVFFIAAIAASGLGLLLIPPLVGETVDLVKAAPDILEDLERGRGPLGSLEREFNLVDRMRGAIESGGAGGVLGFTTPVVSIAKTIVSTVFSMIAIAFLTFFLLLDGRRWAKGFLDVVPDPARPRWERVFDGIYRTVGGYVTGNLFISVIAGTVAGVTLFAVGVPYALALGLLVAILDLIPLIGAAIATAVAGGVALTEGLVPCIVVVVVLIVYQQIENNVIQPLVYGRSVALSPLAILIAVLVGAELAGVLGALAAIPVAGSVQVIARELLRWRRETMIETPVGTALAEDESSPSS